MFAVGRLRRALDLSLSIRNRERIEGTVTAIFDLYDLLAASPLHIGLWVFPFDFLYDKRDILKPEQFSRIIQDLESMLAKTSASGSDFDPFGAEAAAERLAQHYRRENDQASVQRVIKTYGSAFETMSQGAGAMLATAWLHPVMERYQQERRLFPLEIALDLFYFQKLVRLMESLSGKEAGGTRRFLGRSIAIQNLLWAYRYRIYGRMTPEQIINYTLHRAFGAGLDTVRRVALGTPLAVEAARFGFEVAPDLPEVEALTEIEILAGRELWRRAVASMTHPLFDLGGVFAYLWLLDAEVRDLMVVAEGKTMGLSGPEIARRMVRTA